MAREHSYTHMCMCIHVYMYVIRAQTQGVIYYTNCGSITYLDILTCIAFLCCERTVKASLVIYDPSLKEVIFPNRSEEN